MSCYPKLNHHVRVGVLTHLPLLLLLGCGNLDAEGLFSSGGEGMSGSGGTAGESLGAAGAILPALGGASGAVGASGSANGDGGSPAAGGSEVAGGVAGGAAGRAEEGGSGGSGAVPGEPEPAGGDGSGGDGPGSAGSNGGPPKGCVEQPVGEGMYLFCLDMERAFSDASRVCAEQGMHLAWIESAEENAALAAAARALGQAERIWIGASDELEEGDWRWVHADGTPGPAFWSGGSSAAGGQPVMEHFVNWGRDRPNGLSKSESEACATFTLDRRSLEVGTWNDDPCGARWPFVCEASHPPDQ